MPILKYNNEIVDNSRIAKQAATFYDNVHEHTSERLSGDEKMRVEFVCDAIEDYVVEKDLSILDLGCGRGWMAPFLSRFGKVVGVDFSERAIEFANEHYGNHADFFIAKIEDPFLGLPITKFDVVVSSEVIEHVQHQDAYVEQMWDLLRPNGWCMLTTPNGNVWEYFRSKFSPDDFQPIENWLSPDQLKKLLISQGFSIVRHEGGPIHKYRFGKTAWLQHKYIQRLFQARTTRRVYRKLLLHDALYQLLVAKKTR